MEVRGRKMVGSSLVLEAWSPLHPVSLSHIDWLCLCFHWSVGRQEGRIEALRDGMWPMKRANQTLPNTYLQWSEAEIAAQVPRKSGRQCDKDDQLTIQRRLTYGRQPRWHWTFMPRT